MQNLIKISDKGLVSAKELYLGLGLNKTQWSRWNKSNIMENEFFKEGIDWIGARHNVEGNETMDFAITIEFAKHIAMMSKTEKSHKYRNYFIECEKKAKESQAKLPITYEDLMIRQLQEQKKIKVQIKETKEEVTQLKSDMPLFNVECKEIQSLVRKIGIKTLGGYRSPAYIDNSVRGKVYADIQHQLKREFGVSRYEAIKRCQFQKAKEIVQAYKAPIVLQDKIITLNNQISVEEVI